MSTIKFPILKHLSYSSIKVFRESPQEFKHQYLDGHKPEKSAAMELGSIVDSYLTTPKEFEKTYLVRTVAPPKSEQQRAFAEEIVDTALAGLEPMADEIWRHHYSDKGKSDEAVVEAAKKLFSEIKPYMEYLLDLKQNNKVELSQEIYDKVLAISEAIKIHPIANKWLVETPGDFQKKITWHTTQIDIPILGYLDKVVIDHDKLKAKIIDVKIMDCKNEYQFRAKAKKFWYHGQMWMYTQGLEQRLFDRHNKRYDVQHMFIVVNSKAPHQIMCISLENNDLQVGARDFYGAVEDIRGRLESGNWNHNNGIIKLQLFNKD